MTHKGIYVITPTTKAGPDWNYFLSALGDKKPVGGLIWLPVPGKPVDLSRNKGIEHMLVSTTKDQADLILFVDDDAGWAKGSILRLAERLEDPAVDAVSAVIYKRGFPPTIMAGHYGGMNQNGHHFYDLTKVNHKAFDLAQKHNLKLHHSNRQLFDKVEGDFEEIDGCGAHFLMVKRKVFQYTPAPWFEANKPGGAGEDFDFCRKIKQAGYRLWLDYSVHTSHELGNNVSFGLITWLQMADLAGGIDPILETFKEVQRVLT